MNYQAALGQLTHTGTGKGIGVYAIRAIARGEIVEVCPVILLGGSFDSLPTALQLSVFSWAALGGEMPHALCLGYGGMYNHANPANLIYSIAGERAMQFVAARPIPEGEELTINYNDTKGQTQSTEDVWFRVRGVQPIR